jgi:ABC-type multidrug transport system fused ATPase/permease subunit
LSLRSTIALISQEPILFSGSIRNHLDPDGQFDDARLTASLERVGVRTLLSTPNPLDLTLIEGGNNISAGERQLLCLARCILKTPRILVLDEATAHVDPYCDEAIQRTLREDFADATQIIIAHRLDTIKHCDRLVILKHGEIQSIGTPSQLLGQVGDELSS